VGSAPHPSAAPIRFDCAELAQRALRAAARAPTMRLARRTRRSNEPSMQQRWLPFLSLCAVAGGGTIPAQGTVADRIADLQQHLRSLEAVQPAAPTEDDLDVLDAASVDPSRFTARDVAALVLCLRFTQSLKPAESTALAAFVTTGEGKALGATLAFPLALRGEYDVAARMLAAGLEDTPPERRAYGTWKRWELFFRGREDSRASTRDFTFALLSCFEQGGDVQRRVIGDVLGKPGMSLDDAKQMRAEIRHACEVAAATGAAAAEMLDSDLQRIWVEDHGRLRQVTRQRMARRQSDHVEIRLSRREKPDAPPVEWGRLIGKHLSAGEDELGMLETVRGLAVLAHDPLADFDPGKGPIAVYPAADTEAELRARREGIAAALCITLGAGRVAALTAAHELPPDAGRDSRIADVAREALAAARAAASRIHELATTGARTGGDDQSVLEQLRAAGAHACALLVEVRRGVAAPTGPGSWRDMAFVRMGTDVVARETRGRTHVLQQSDRVQIVELTTTQIQGRSSPTFRATVTALRREDLAAALQLLELVPKDGVLSLLVNLRRTVPSLVAEVTPGTDASACVYCEDAREVAIACDGEEHRQELLAVLKQLAVAAGR